MRSAAIIFCAVIFLFMRGAGAGGDAEPREWSGAFSPYIEFSVQVIRDAENWRQLWAQLHQPSPPDFSAGRDMALAVFLGMRRTGGYDIAIEPAGQSGSAALFRVREVPPAPGAFVTQALTNPYRIILLPANARPALMFVRLHGAAGQECLYIPAGERPLAEAAGPLPDTPICPETMAPRKKRS